MPEGASRFSVHARGAGRAEHIRVRVYNPEGEMVGEAKSKGGAVSSVEVRVPKGQGGKVWWLTADKPPEFPGVFEDGSIWLSGDVPPLVSPQEEGLLVPFCRGLFRRPLWRSEGEALELSFSPNIEPPAGATLSVEVVRDGERIAEGRAKALRGEELRLSVEPHIPPGEYLVRATLLDPRGEVLALAEVPLILTSKMAFLGGWRPLIEADLVWEEGENLPPRLVLRSNIEGGPPLKVRLSLLKSPVSKTPGTPEAESVLKRTFLLPLGGEVKVDSPQGLLDGQYQWRVEAIGPEGELLDIVWKHFVVWRGRFFREVTPPPSAPFFLPLERFGPGAKRRGFLLFVPEAVEALPFNYRPSRKDLSRPLQVVAAKGEFEPATFGIWAVQEVRGLRMSVRPPRHSLTGRELEVDLRLARYWAQRVSWNTTTYRVIPEILDPPSPKSLSAGQVCQVWLTVYVPPDAPSGKYEGRVVVSDSKGRKASLPLTVFVLPFQLLKPKGIYWGLYSDSARWRRYSDEKVKAELRDIVEHGITTLMCYPLTHSVVRYEGGRVKVDAREFVKYMRMAKEAGLGPPWVMSVQGLSGLVRRLLPGREVEDPEFKRVYQAILLQLSKVAKSEGWGECFWHAIDEPFSKERIRRAVVELGYIKELGLKTFTTAGPVPPELDRVLDARCYNLGYLLGKRFAQREETLRSGDRFWFYGSGCYTGQEGNIIANRYITGLLFWLSKAEAEWSWTFIRPKGDPFNDFDGERYREAKDACIAYPSPGQGKPLPTLQWEGIREGIDDYRYLYTLTTLARQTGGKKGKEALRRLERLLREVPVPRSKDFTAFHAQRLRLEVARLILEILGYDPRQFGLGQKGPQKGGQ
ncbi:MAG TPA: DUF4091 domain-containing protein [Armatimonadetes bacterium]|nr:DUF4091 domain-containing protein [Armatimonadota bacterium]